ncbi:MAG: preprotein translocase subunit SecG [Candidatus Omnitrophota bacterium]|nr:preprotein translocase subunit SecG [Candidatus Omnitrophota bacterium]
MYIAIIIVHLIVCLVLISVILLQAGRGGGLTEMFGGDTAQSLFGTQAPVLLKKATTISAIAFLVTSLLLGMVTARKGRSLFEGARFDVPPGEAREGVSPVVKPKLPEEEAVPAEVVPAQTEKVPPETEAR